MSNWFVEQRLAWIKESVEIFGAIRREHIMRKFGISLPQTSADLQKVLARWPELMAYNPSSKCYELVDDLRSIEAVEGEAS